MYVSLQDQKLTHNNYKNMIQAWLIVTALYYIYVPFISFWLKSALIALEKNEYWFPRFRSTTKKVYHSFTAWAEGSRACCGHETFWVLQCEILFSWYVFATCKICFRLIYWYLIKNILMNTIIYVTNWFQFAVKMVWLYTCTLDTFA